MRRMGRILTEAGWAGVFMLTLYLILDGIWKGGYDQGKDEGLLEGVFWRRNIMEREGLIPRYRIRYPEVHDDGLGAARGLVISLIISLALGLAVGVVVYVVAR